MLVGTPLVAQGSPSSVEGGPGCYTHLLHVNLQDAGRRQETTREVHVELLLARFPARGITRGGDRHMNYRVPTCDSRRARHTSSSAYQRGPSD